MSEEVQKSPDFLPTEDVMSEEVQKSPDFLPTEDAMSEEVQKSPKCYIFVPGKKM